MSLRYAILALLAVQPMTGYDLRRRFASSVGHVWHAPDSQIYPELKKMEHAGLLSSTSVVRGEHGSKRWYRITDDGTAEFRRWMNEPVVYRRVRDPAHLKASYLEWAEPDAARAMFRAHIEHFTGELEQWLQQAREIDGGASEMLSSRLEVTPANRRARTIAFKKHTYAGLIARAEQEISWAREGLALVDALDDAED